MIVVMQSQSLKGSSLQKQVGVLVGKKHDEISSFNKNNFRKRWRVLGSIPKNAYRTNEGSNDRVLMEPVRILGFRPFLQSRQQRQ